jgi:hypothetical protein
MAEIKCSCHVCAFIGSGDGVLGSPLLSLWFWVWRERGHTNPREGSIWVREEEESKTNFVFLFNTPKFK